MEGPLASNSENRMTFGMRTKHGEDQKKTKKAKTKPPKQKRKLEPNPGHSEMP